MGKGNRNSQRRLEELQKNSERIAANKKKADNKKKGDRAVTIALAAVALIVVAVLVVSLLATNGVFIRSEAAMSTANVKVDSAMMNFFFNNYLSSWYTNYSSYLSAGYFSLDPSLSLKLQNYGAGYEIYFLGEYTGTWYNYFLDQVCKEVETYIIYAEGAIAAGLTLTDEDKTQIDELIVGIKAGLKEAKVSFGDWYGKGVKESDVRRAYELVFLAENFMEYKQAELEKGLDADGSAIDKYVEENKSKFYTADVLKFTITTLSKNFGNDAAFDLATQMAVEAANKIAAATTPEEFAQLVKEYEDSKKTSTSTETENTTEETEETTESAEATEETTEAIEETEETTEATEETLDTDKYKTTITYNVADDLGKWLFENKATANTTKVIEATADKTETVKGETKPDGTKTEDTQVAYEEHTVTVYLVVEPMHVDKDLTKNCGYFISDDKALVEEFLNKVKDSVKTYEEFQKAAEAFNTKIHEGHDHEDENATEPVIMFEGVEELQDGYFPDSYSVLGEWIDADDREENTFSDIVEIKIDDKTTYYGFGYFEKYGNETWYVNGYAYTLDEQFQGWVAEQKTATPITVNNKALTNSITPLMYASNESHEGHDH